MQAERAGVEVTPATAKERRDRGEIGLVAQGTHLPCGDDLGAGAPALPAPHQVAVELWETTVEKKITSKRSLIYHAQVTLSATLAGLCHRHAGWAFCWRSGLCIAASWICR